MLDSISVWCIVFLFLLHLLSSFFTIGEKQAPLKKVSALVGLSGLSCREEEKLNSPLLEYPKTFSPRFVVTFFSFTGHASLAAEVWRVVRLDLISGTSGRPFGWVLLFLVVLAAVCDLVLTLLTVCPLLPYPTERKNISWCPGLR